MLLSYRGSSLLIFGSRLLIRFLVTCKSFYSFRINKICTTTSLPLELLHVTYTHIPPLSEKGHLNLWRIWQRDHPERFSATGCSSPASPSWTLCPLPLRVRAQLLMKPQSFYPPQEELENILQPLSQPSQKALVSCFFLKGGY